MEIEFTEAGNLVRQFWADVSLVGESMPFVETMAEVQRSSGNGFVDSWRRGEITPRLLDCYQDFTSWAMPRGEGVPSMVTFLKASEDLGFQVKQISRTWVGPESVSQDRMPTCLKVPALKSLREQLGTAEFFVQGRYDAKQAA